MGLFVCQVSPDTKRKGLYLIRRLQAPQKPAYQWYRLAVFFFFLCFFSFKWFVFLLTQNNGFCYRMLPFQEYEALQFQLTWILHWWWHRLAGFWTVCGPSLRHRQSRQKWCRFIIISIIIIIISTEDQLYEDTLKMSEVIL